MIPKLMRVDEVASLLGISKSYVYQMTRTGELPSIKMGAAVRVRPEDLVVFIEKNLFGGYSDFSTPSSKPNGTFNGLKKR